MQSISHYAGDLTLLYTETKKKALDSIGKNDSTPKLPHLDRKLRIQKDRLITWGLEWTDQGDQDKGSGGDIDESVARAGVTETVTSVLGNIQEVLEQAENIKTSASAWPAPEKADLSTAHEAKYQDLLKDLESSVDILYEISRSRRALASGSHPTFSSDRYPHEYAPGTIVSESSYPAFEAGYYSHEHGLGSKPTDKKTFFQSPSFASSQTTLINPPPFARPNLSPYAALPTSLDPQALVLPAEAPPPYETFGVPSAARMIGRLIKSRIPESVRAVLSNSSPEAYVLVEYANYDPLYHETGVPPPLQRLEGLAAALHQAQARQQRSLILLGYFEDPYQPRIGLVYDFLGAIHGGVAALDLERDQLFPVSLLNLLQTANKGLKPADISNATPFLEDRFRVALRVASNLKDLHADGYAHGNLNSGSVIFFRQGTNPQLRRGELHRPTLSAFDMFSKNRIERGGTVPGINISKHPLDSDSNIDSVKSIQFDLYGLALLLLEIGLWIPLHDLYKPKYTLKDFKLRIEKIWVPRLASKCGSLYMRAVQACLRLSDDPDIGKIDTEHVYEGIIRRLQRCCFLDEDEPIWPRSEPTHAPSQSSSWQSITQVPSMHQSRSYVERGPTRPSFDGSTLPSSRSIITSDAATPLPNVHSASANQRKRHLPYEGRLSHTHLDGQSKSSSSIVPTLDPSVHESQQTKQDEASHSVPEYHRKVMLIQACWRERCRRKAEADQSRKSLPQADRSHSSLGNQPHIHSHRIDTVDSQSRRSEGVSRHSSEMSRECQMFPVKLPEPVLHDWTSCLGVRICRIVERALKDSSESTSIDLVGLGKDYYSAKPTILVTCTSTTRVKAALKRKLDYDRSIFDLKVRKGQVRLARGKASVKERLARRASGADCGDSESDDTSPLNPFFQPRPLCGASIGAYLPNHGHLDPVSYGGVVMVEKDGQTQHYGMSVHHMLDPPDGDDNESASSERGSDEASRSSSSSDVYYSDASEVSEFTGSDDEDAGYTSSDFESDISEDELTTIPGRMVLETGDKPGIQTQDLRVVPVTQPAFRDAWELDLHADDAPLEELDEDHLSSYKFGKIHASSGLRRTIKNGMRHEIDWALIELEPPRVQPYNIIRGGRRYCRIKDNIAQTPEQSTRRLARLYNTEEDLCPVDIIPLEQLASLKVHCFGRTSGLRSGTISGGMSFVKIRGRRNFSHSWGVIGEFGVGGDSGAWVVDNASGRVCGHVLAERDGMTYICSMQLLFEDMKNTLGANRISLPGGLVREDATCDDVAALTGDIAGAVAKLGIMDKDTRRSRYAPGRQTEKKELECSKLCKHTQAQTVRA